jgi:hypothetical protein
VPSSSRRRLSAGPYACGRSWKYVGRGPEVALDLALLIEDGTDLIQFVFAKIADLCSAVDTGLTEDVERSGPADAVNVRQTNFCPFIGRQINTCYTSHKIS